MPETLWQPVPSATAPEWAAVCERPFEVIDDPLTGPRARVKTVRGFHIEVMPMLVNWRLHTIPVDDGPLAWSDRFWCYDGLRTETFVAAVLAAHAWDGGAYTEPVGWIRSWDGRRQGPAAGPRAD